MAEGMDSSRAGISPASFSIIIPGPRMVAESRSKSRVINPKKARTPVNVASCPDKRERSSDK